MRVAAWQAAGRPGELEDNLARLDAATEAAAAAGVDLLVSPEMFATGYALERGLEDPRTAEAVRASAARHGVAQVWSEPFEGCITAAVCDAEGRLLGRYRKVHLWGPGERAAFAPGDSAPLVVALGGLRVGVAICYDVEFPEAARAAARAGADVLCAPTALEDPAVARVLVPARAMENGMVVVYANHADGGQPPGGPRFCGASLVAGPDGAVLAAAGGGSGGEEAGEQLLVADVDPAHLAAVRARNPYAAELRPHVYRTWAPETSEERA